VGRASDNTIVLEDDYASGHHARFFGQDGQWYVEDLGSTNGTYLGTQRITQPAPIGLGAQVRIGKTILELRK
jgi:pSer/pThr/pTyr-binding forkhead associated (FHA) protein